MRLGDDEMLRNKLIEAAMFICFNKWSASQPFFVDLARHTTNIKVFCNKAVSSRTAELMGRDNTDWVFLLSRRNFMIALIVGTNSMRFEGFSNLMLPDQSL